MTYNLPMIRGVTQGAQNTFLGPVALLISPATFNPGLEVRRGQFSTKKLYSYGICIEIPQFIVLSHRYNFSPVCDSPEPSGELKSNWMARTLPWCIGQVPSLSRAEIAASRADNAPFPAASGCALALSSNFAAVCCPAYVARERAVLPAKSVYRSPTFIEYMRGM